MRAFASWFRRPPPAASTVTTPAPAPRVVPSVPVPTDRVEHTAEWFAEEPTAIQALAQATLAALLQAGPQPVDAPATLEETRAWLDEAFARLATLPTPLTPPPQADGLSWRYLVFTRVLSDALDAAYTTAFRRHPPMHCPLTPMIDPHRVSRPRVKPQERATLDAAGLGVLLAGARLPEAGRQQLLQALAQGIDWVDAAAFWTMNATASTMTLQIEMPVAASGADDATASTMTLQTEIPVAASGADDATADQPTSASEADAGLAGVSRPEANPATADTTPLSDAFHAAARALMASPVFNRQSGDGWNCDGVVWVVAKLFAERLLNDPWVQTQPALQHRQTLYRRLMAQGLIRAHGAEPVWKMYVIEAGSTPRYASVLKLAGAVVDGPRYAGTVQDASAFVRDIAP